jgi:hypothetical protein
METPGLTVSAIDACGSSGGDAASVAAKAPATTAASVTQAGVAMVALLP